MWNKIIEHFQTLEHRPLERMIILVGGLMFFWIIEGAIPLFSLQYKKNKLRHGGVNFIFTVFHIVLHTGLAFFIVELSDWCLRNGVGLVHWFNAGIVMTIIIGVGS